MLSPCAQQRNTVTSKTQWFNVFKWMVEGEMNVSAKYKQPKYSQQNQRSATVAAETISVYLTILLVQNIKKSEPLTIDKECLFDWQSLLLTNEGIAKLLYYW